MRQDRYGTAPVAESASDRDEVTALRRENQVLRQVIVDLLLTLHPLQNGPRTLPQNSRGS